MLEEPFFSDKYARFYMEKCNLECVLVRSQVTSRNIGVRYESRKHLNEEELINDEIMEFFMNDIHEKFIRKDEKTKIVINDSYFFTRLLRDIEIDAEGSLSIDSRNNLDRNIHGIVKWKRIKEKDRIFEQDLVIIPICSHGHWFVAVIKNPTSCLKIMIKCELSQESDPKEPCQIFLYDSFIEEENCLRHAFIKIIKYYLISYFAIGYQNGSYVDYEFVTKNLKYYPIMNPIMQTNEFDCGLYICEFVSQILNNLSILNDIVNEKAMGIAMPTFSIETKRRDIRNSIYSHLSKTMQLEVGLFNSIYVLFIKSTDGKKEYRASSEALNTSSFRIKYPSQES